MSAATAYQKRQGTSQFIVILFAVLFPIFVSLSSFLWVNIVIIKNFIYFSIIILFFYAIWIIFCIENHILIHVLVHL